jgi:CubicO group peptidase (beta-lactamase class C family)
MLPRLPVLLLACLTLAGCGRYAPDRMASVATGFAAHQLCGAAFIAGLEPEAYWAEAAPPAMRLVDWALLRQVDRARGEVRTSLAGVGERVAVHRGQAGCLVLNAPAPAPLAALPDLGPALLAEIAPGPELVPGSPALAMALDHAFAESDPEAPLQTRAVVVLHRGRLVAERYAPGYGLATRLHGWSMTKSVTNALLGVLARQGKVAMQAPLGLPEWAGDGRAALTPDHLLRMVSGLRFGNSLGAGFGDLVNPASQMLFGDADMAADAVSAPLDEAPGSHWEYSNGNTQILSRVIRDLAGGDEAAVLRFARAELFGPLGMRSAVLETDGTGTPVGAAYMWATARDWARFGQLYAQNGVVGGRRLLPEGWVAYSAAPTPGGIVGYGAGFWTNQGDSFGARRRVDQGMPAEAFMARGAFGQFVVVVPSRQLVVARLGYTFSPRAATASMVRLVVEAMAAAE